MKRSIKPQTAAAVPNVEHLHNVSQYFNVQNR